ncbi:isoprenylcysteine carboxylmethyltransferase family protein [bacterium]|nr:isoprenylcysteine carboxylmethyltransferase family protein [bacterium]
MEKKLSRFDKLFGSGPAGLLISLVLLFIAGWLDRRFDLPPISESGFLLNSVFAVSCLLTLVVIVWSVKSLPTADRGSRLCTSGAFRYMRHPLYAAFLSVFDFGLAIFLNSYIFVLWAILLHPVWHYVIRYEERLMIDIFGETYIEYEKKTGRFFPRLMINRL